ncbi:MAG: carbamoyl-phosphate synthase large subunit, partial [Candidatus Chloroheliales bacterium]
MPLDPTLRKVLIIGSGPIVIGQAAEFDYAGTQACLAVREDGVKVVLVNSNPATIQTDRDTADTVYLEPLTAPTLTAIIERERPDGIIAGMGGQTALNLAVALEQAGVLARYGVRLLGTPSHAIRAAEDRHEFAALVQRLGYPVLPHVAITAIEAAEEFALSTGFPLVIRAAFCLGGTGSGVAHDLAGLHRLVTAGLRLSPVGQVLLEKSVVGWAEIEVEVVRDGWGNAIQICNMENLDPMGIHTGESIVVAPTQTLANADVQRLRSAALDIVSALGVEGGCNCQFALNQQSGEVAVIEVNPRLSRSSALASKATGYPIARVAAKIALGYTLDELRNSITGASAALEPALDYVVVKIPRWPFDKFPQVDPHLGVGMKSTGEVMAIGRSFEAALQKALRSLDGRANLLEADAEMDDAALEDALRRPTHQRLRAVYTALARGWSQECICQFSNIHPWFIARIAAIEAASRALQRDRLPLLIAKLLGFGDEQLAGGRSARLAANIRPAYKMVDTCAGEFAASTPYFYSTYAGEDEAAPLPGPKAIILGSGPIRIGQGIEFDYSAVHAVRQLAAAGIGAIMVNNNPETVSTDYNISDRLYFEPLSVEEVLNIVEHEADGLLGVIAQFGGQTALNLVAPLAAHGVTILGTPPAGIAAAEDRRQTGELAGRLGLAMPAWGTAHTAEEAIEVAAGVGYPVLVRPSYVLGGRGMRVVHDQAALVAYFAGLDADLRRHPLLIDRFLEGAIELDVDAVSDGRDTICVVMEQVEYAGIHSGDSACVYPPHTISPATVCEVEQATARLAEALGIVGLMNAQYALHEDRLYLLEVNARASRTVPFASKAAGVPLAALATQVILGQPLRDLDATLRRDRVAVKLPVLPFRKLSDLTPLPGPEMQSTGETMGIAANYPLAYAKALLAAGVCFDRVTRQALLCGFSEELASVRRELEQASFTVLQSDDAVAGEELLASGEITLVVCLADRASAPLARLLRLAVAEGVPVINDRRTLGAYLCA